jgi:hypothetical protein
MDINRYRDLIKKKGMKNQVIELIMMQYWSDKWSAVKANNMRIEPTHAIIRLNRSCHQNELPANQGRILLIKWEWIIPRDKSQTWRKIKKYKEKFFSPV